MALIPLFCKLNQISKPRGDKIWINDEFDTTYLCYVISNKVQLAKQTI